MILTARLLWGFKFYEKIFENMSQVMHFDKSWYKNYRLHIEIMILYLHACCVNREGSCNYEKILKSGDIL